MNMKFEIGQEIREFVGDATFMAIECDIHNSESDVELWREIDKEVGIFRKKFQLQEVNKRETIAATREVYKRCGKDPNRYRPSAEALSRRLLKGDELYRVDTAVDLINYVSFVTGFSIGGFDEEKIKGDVLTLGIGKEGEPYEGIGRGMLNIAGLPVWRDAEGGIGTPTSDNERTKLSIHTKKLLIIVNAYGGNDSLGECYEMFVSLLRKYLNAENIEKREMIGR